MGWDVTRFPKVIVRQNRRQECVKKCNISIKNRSIKNNKYALGSVKSDNLKY